MSGYTLFLEIDGVERKIKAHQSLVKSPLGDYVKIWYSDLQEDAIDTDIIDRLNESVKDKKFKASYYKQDVIEYGTFDLSYQSPCIMDFLYLYKDGVEFEEPKPIDPYAKNPTKELCHCKKNIAITFYYQWWCYECHKNMNWD